MLTFFKQIFVWWNQQTLGTRIQTIFYGKFVGQDSFGNKYYQSKSGKRWVIYNGEVEASKMKKEEIGAAKHWKSPYKFDKPVKEHERPPFPSASEYDAKAWSFIMKHGKRDCLFWNVGA